jgi:hypothetical protein
LSLVGINPSHDNDPVVFDDIESLEIWIVIIHLDSDGSFPVVELEGIGTGFGNLSADRDPLAVILFLG